MRVCFCDVVLGFEAKSSHCSGVHQRAIPSILFWYYTAHAGDNQLTKRKAFLQSQFEKCCCMINWPHCSWAGTKVSEHMVVPIGWLIASAVDTLTTPGSTHPRARRFLTCPSLQDSTASFWIAACQGPLGMLKIQTTARTLLPKALLSSRLSNMSLRRQAPTTSNPGSLQSVCDLSFSHQSLCLWF